MKTPMPHVHVFPTSSLLLCSASPPGILLLLPPTEQGEPRLKYTPTYQPGGSEECSLERVITLNVLLVVTITPANIPYNYHLQLEHVISSLLEGGRAVV